ncbi:hypothetical protein PYW07_004654 [Mythimna separata]|uniref:Uncharacterized protein n=1 Tax=Mythimna separata TaxID=271217 RepID=A0AAD7YZ21_MYTSE|nr:hypothetical protein PYW07_004654 [Mythimna separata]
MFSVVAVARVRVRGSLDGTYNAAPARRRHSGTLRPRASQTFFVTTLLSVENDIFVTMKRGLVVFLTMCVFAIAMVPRDRRAVNPDEQEKSKDEGAVVVCAAATPCAWSVYRPIVKIIDLNITNSYCKCSADSECERYEDDVNANTIVYRCRKRQQRTTDS